MRYLIIVMLLSSQVAAKPLYSKRRKARRYGRCYLIHHTVKEAKKSHVPADILISIAIHESRLDHLALGDDGFSFGAWQLNSKLWKVKKPFHPISQTRFAAKLLKRFISKTKTMKGAIQRWNYRSKGYASRVMKRKKQAQFWINKCQQKENNHE